MKEMLDGFFGENPEFWIGKVVSIESQKQTAQGFSWGWRYKVRIFGTYSNSDNIQDKDCHTAMVMLGVTDGSGGAGRTRAVRITQHDIVFGLFMAPDQNFPVIMGVLGRTKGTVKIGGKFGILTGFTKNLELNGVGYRAALQGNILKLSLGYSHDIDFEVPESVKITVPKPTEIIINGIDQQIVGQVAANIREKRKPEPYKGKGIRYKDEYVFAKEGKKK